MKKIIPTLLLLLCSNSFAGEKIKIFKPAFDVLWGIKKIAVSEIKDNENIPVLLSTKLKRTQFFNVIECRELEKVLLSQHLTKDDLKNIDKSKEVYNTLKIDGLIFGEINTYQVEPDENGIEQVSKQIWTGKYERDENDKIIEENIDGNFIKKKLVEEKIIDQKYRIRKGIVSITLNLIDIKSGKIAISKTVVKNYDSGKVPEDKTKSLLSAEKILQNLSDEVVTDFVKYISPTLKTEKRDIESGEGLIDEGKIYATSGLWHEAIETWLKAETAFPNNSAVYYNLGLAYEAIGEYKEAHTFYKKAALLKDEKLYKKAQQRLKKAYERKQKELKNKE